MKILLYGINFSPELTGIGKYTGEMAEWLAARGHKVCVVTAPPYYPEWRVWKKYSAWKYGKEILSAPLIPALTRDGGAGIVVHRCPIWVPARPTGLKRIAHLASFALSSLPVLLRQVFWRPDVVWVVEPPLFCAPGAWLAARLCGARAWMHVQDFEVDAAFDLGLLPRGMPRQLALAVERSVLRRFDRVSTISGNMLTRLSEKGVESAVLFPNWVDTRQIFPMDGTNPVRAELGLPDDAVVALYSGNMGRKQGLELLVDAARRLQDYSSVRIVLCGEGVGRSELEGRAKGLVNVTFLPLQPAARLNALLNVADIHLLPQRADAADLVMPSKLTGMFASGRPVIATAASETQVALAVAGRGIVVPPEQPEAFATAIVDLARDTALRMKLGVEARRYAMDHFERDAVLGRFETELISLVEQAR